MKTFIKDGKMSVDIHDLFDSMTDEDRKVFCKFAVFSETLFEGIINTVVSGETWDDGWWIGGMDQRLRAKLIPLMPEIVREFVAGLLTEHARYAKAVKMHEDMLFRLMREWPNVDKCPAERSYMRPQENHFFTSDEAEAYIAKQLGDEWQAIKDRAAQESPVENVT